MTCDAGEKQDRWNVSGLFVPAGLFIGAGVGWILGYIVQGLLIGLGTGFLTMALVRFRASKW